MSDATAYLESKRPTAEFDDDALRIAAAQAIYQGLKTLTKLSKLENGRIKVEGGEYGESYEYPDLEAAKKLLDSGLKIKQILGAKREAEKGQKDLFDLASKQSTDSNWKFNKVE